MELWISISLVVSNVLDDAIATLCTLAILRRRKMFACILTVILTYLVSWSVRNYAHQYAYVHVVSWSSGLGCFLGIYVDQWYRKREKLRNLEKARLTKKAKQIAK